MVKTVSEPSEKPSPQEAIAGLKNASSSEAHVLLEVLDAPLIETPEALASAVVPWLRQEETCALAARVLARHRITAATDPMRLALARSTATDTRLALLAAVASLGERELFLRTLRTMLVLGKEEAVQGAVTTLERHSIREDGAEIFALLSVCAPEHRLQFASLSYRHGVRAAYSEVMTGIGGMGPQTSGLHIEARLRAVARLASTRFCDALVDYAARESRPFFAARARSIASALSTHGKSEPTPATLFLDAKERYFEGDHDGALAKLGDLLELGVDQADWRHLQASCYRELDQTAAAQEACDAGIVVDPSHWQTHRLNGSLLWDLKEYEAALEAYDRALSLHPTDPYSWYYKGYALYCLEEDAAALPCLDRALSLNKDSAYLYNQKAFCLERLKRHDEAIACYHRSLALRPDDGLVHDYLGQALQATRRYPEALVAFDTALKLEPSRDEILYHRADVLYDMELWQDAAEAYETYLQHSPRSYHGWFNRGLCCRFMRSYREAIICFDKAIELRNDGASAKRHRDYCLKELGRLEER